MNKATFSFPDLTEVIPEADMFQELDECQMWDIPHPLSGDDWFAVICADGRAVMSITPDVPTITALSKLLAFLSSRGFLPTFRPASREECRVLSTDR